MEPSVNCKKALILCPTGMCNFVLG